MLGVIRKESCKNISIWKKFVTNVGDHHLPQKWVSWVWHWTASNCGAQILELWEVLSISKLQLLLGPLCPGVVVYVQVPLLNQVDWIVCKKKKYLKQKHQKI